MTTDKLNAATIRELLAKITPEPWEVGPDVPDLPYRYSNFVHGRNVAKARVLNADDAKFIAAAPAIARYALELSTENTWYEGETKRQAQGWTETLNELDSLRAQLQSQAAELERLRAIEWAYVNGDEESLAELERLRNRLKFVYESVNHCDGVVHCNTCAEVQGADLI
jgi:hypothetical protein